MAEVGRWKPYTQRQGQLLPAFVEDALDPGDPVFFIHDAVDSLDLMPLEQRYAMLGEHAYSPRLLLKAVRRDARSLQRAGDRAAAAARPRVSLPRGRWAGPGLPHGQPLSAAAPG